MALTDLDVKQIYTHGEGSTPNQVFPITFKYFDSGDVKVIKTYGTPTSDSFGPNITNLNRIPLTAHDFSTGQQVTLSSTDTLPTGLSSQNYYVKDLGANEIALAILEADAKAANTDIRDFTDGEVATDQITVTAHVFTEEQAVIYNGGLTNAITELSDGTTYYIKSIASNTVQLSATAGGAALTLTTTGADSFTLTAAVLTEISLTGGAGTHSIVGATNDVTLVLTDDYTLTGSSTTMHPTAATALPIEVTLNIEHYIVDSTETLTVVRDVNSGNGSRDGDVKQGTSLSTFGEGKQVEEAIDRNTAYIQEIQEEVDRAIKIPVTSTSGANLDLPSPEANKFLGWNSGATNLENKDGSATDSDAIHSNGVAEISGEVLASGAQNKADLIIIEDASDTQTKSATIEQIMDLGVKVSTDDTTPSMLEDKLVVADESNSTNILEIKIVNPGADEDIKIALDETKIDHSNLLASSLTTGDDHTQYILGSTSTADPTGVVTPGRVGEVHIDTVLDAGYVAVGVTSADWVSIGSVAGTSLANLSDTTITTPANGQSLVYNGTAWINTTAVATGSTPGNISAATIDSSGNVTESTSTFIGTIDATGTGIYIIPWVPGTVLSNAIVVATPVNAAGMIAYVVSQDTIGCTVNIETDAGVATNSAFNLYLTTSEDIDLSKADGVYYSTPQLVSNEANDNLLHHGCSNGTTGRLIVHILDNVASKTFSDISTDGGRSYTRLENTDTTPAHSANTDYFHRNIQAHTVQSGTGALDRFYAIRELTGSNIDLGYGDFSDVIPAMTWMNSAILTATGTEPITGVPNNNKLIAEDETNNVVMVMGIASGGHAKVVPITDIDSSPPTIGKDRKVEDSAGTNYVLNENCPSAIFALDDPTVGGQTRVCILATHDVSPMDLNLYRSDDANTTTDGTNLWENLQIVQSNGAGTAIEWMCALTEASGVLYVLSANETNTSIVKLTFVDISVASPTVSDKGDIIPAWNNGGQVDRYSGYTPLSAIGANYKPTFKKKSIIDGNFLYALIDMVHNGKWSVILMRYNVSTFAVSYEFAYVGESSTPYDYQESQLVKTAGGKFKVIVKRLPDPGNNLTHGEIISKDIVEGDGGSSGIDLLSGKGDMQNVAVDFTGTGDNNGGTPIDEMDVGKMDAGETLIISFTPLDTTEHTLTVIKRSNTNSVDLGIALDKGTISAAVMTSTIQDSFQVFKLTITPDVGLGAHQITFTNGHGTAIQYITNLTVMETHFHVDHSTLEVISAGVSTAFTGRGMAIGPNSEYIFEEDDASSIENIRYQDAEDNT